MLPERYEWGGAGVRRGTLRSVSRRDPVRVPEEKGETG
jgi:hypothetical protein